MLHGFPQGLGENFFQEFTASLRLCAQQAFLQCTGAADPTDPVCSAGYQLLRLALSLEDVSQLCHGAGHPKVLDLNRQVQDLWYQVDAVLRQRCRPQLRSCCHALPVRADPRLLNSALLHLIHNALRYALPPITICCRQLGSRAVVLVEDSGPLLPAPPPGYGLGLPLARLLAKQAGGALLLEHTCTGHTRAILSLPKIGEGGICVSPHIPALDDRYSPLFVLLSDLTILPDG